MKQILSMAVSVKVHKNKALVKIRGRGQPIWNVCGARSLENNGISLKQ